jgi:uncharacterized protein YjbI with pentapeptide repeats
MIGTKISKARKEKRLSQADLAQHLSVSPQAVGKWERGESMPDIIMFDRLAKSLDVELNYFSENFQSDAIQKTSTESLIGVNSKSSPARSKRKHGWDMSGGNWVDADFSGLRNLHEKFSGSNMQRCIFIGADLSGLLLKSNNVNGCDFSNADISYSSIRSSNLVNNVFHDCLLKDSEFLSSHIKDCDFAGADFTEALFKSSALQKNLMTNAIWSGTSFYATQFSDIIIEGTVEDCSFVNCDFTKLTFRNATLKNTFFKNNFKNKSFKKIRFVDCKADNITYAFLKTGMADLTGITLLTP